MNLSRFACSEWTCKKWWTSYNILESSKIISEQYWNDLKGLLHHYYPAEIDPHCTIIEKLLHLRDWWTKAHDCPCQQMIEKFQIAQVVRVSNAMLREGFKTRHSSIISTNITFSFSSFPQTLVISQRRLSNRWKCSTPLSTLCLITQTLRKTASYRDSRASSCAQITNKNNSVCENSG